MAAGSRQKQAERHADEAAARVTRKRAQQSGVSGWVADRAGQWSLEGPDAIRSCVPIVPIATIGGPDSMPALLPELPLPTKIRTAFQEPISLDCDPERASDDAYVDVQYELVCRRIQEGMDALARRRRLPLFG
jgi:hypothetical protein